MWLKHGHKRVCWNIQLFGGYKMILINVIEYIYIYLMGNLVNMGEFIIATPSDGTLFPQGSHPTPIRKAQPYGKLMGIGYHRWGSL